MSNNNDQLQILIQAKLDTTPKAVSKLDKDIETLSNNVTKLKLKVDIDNKQLLNISKQLEKLQKQFSTGFAPTIDTKEIKKNAIQVVTDLDAAFAKYKNKGLITVPNKVFDPISKELRQFTLQIEQTDGVIQKMNFDIIKLANGDKITNAFKLSGLKEIDKTAEILEKQVQQQAQIKNKINKIKEEEMRKKESADKEYQQWWKKSVRLQEIAEEEAYKKRLQNLENFKERYISKINDLQRRFGKKIDNDALNSIKTELGSLDIGNADLDKRLNDIPNQIRRIGSEAQTAASHHLSFASAMKIALSRIVQWGVATGIVYSSLHQLQSGIKYIYDLDNSLNEVRIVTGKTKEEVKELAVEYTNLSKQMSVASNEVISTSVDLFRQGLSEQDVDERMKAIITYAKISGITLEQSNKIITSTTNALGESVQKTIDIMAQLGDSSAADAQEVGEALQRTASEAKDLHVTLEKVSSWISTISSVTREGPSQIGNSIKSIMARYSQIKETGFNNEDATGLNEVVKALTQIGIKAVDANGQLRDFSSVMDDLGSRYKSLDENSKSYISTVMAGTFQMNRFKTLLDNYGQSMKYYELAQNSAGVASEKFAIWQESSAAKTEKLRSVWEGFWQKSLDSGTVNAFLDAVTVLLERIDNLGNVAIFASGMLIAFNRKAIAGLIVSSYESAKGLFAVKTALNSTTLAANGATVAMQRTQAAMGWIGLLLTVGSTIYTMFDKTNDSMTKTAEELEEVNKKYKEHVDQLKEVKTFYDENYKSINSNVDVKRKLFEMQNELVKTFGNEANGIDLVNGKYDEQIEKINQLKRVDLERKISEKSIKVDAIESQKYGKPGLFHDVKDATNKVLDIRQYYQELLQIQDKLLSRSSDAFASSAVLPKTPKEWDNRSEALTKRIDEIKKEIDQLDGISNDMFQLMVHDIETNGKDLNDKAKSVLEAFAKTLSTSGQTTEEVVGRINQEIKNFTGENGLSTFLNQYDSLKKQLSESPFDTNIANQMDQLKDKIMEWMYGIQSFSSATDEGRKSFIDFTNSFTEYFKLDPKSIKSFAQVQDELGVAFKNTSKSIEPLNKLLQDYADGKSVNASEAAELIETDKSLVSLFYEENGVLKLNVDAVKNKKAAYLDAFKTQEQIAKNEVINANKALLDKLKIYQLEIGALDNLVEANKTLDESYQSRMQNAKTYSEVLEVSKQYSSVKDFLKNLQDIETQAKISSAAANTVGISNNKDSNNYTDKLFQDLPEYKERAEDLQSQLKALNNAISDVQNAMSLAEKSGDLEKKLQKEKELNDLLQQRKDKYHEIADALRSMRDGEISTKFNENFGDLAKGRNFSDISKEEIKNYADTLDKQLNDLDNKIGHASNDAAKAVFENQKEALQGKKELLNYYSGIFDDIDKLIQTQSDSWISDNEKQTDTLKSIRQSYFDQSEKWIEQEIVKMQLAGNSELEISQMVYDARVRMAADAWTEERGIVKLSAEERVKADKSVYDAFKDLQDKTVAEFQKSMKKYDDMLDALQRRLSLFDQDDSMPFDPEKQKQANQILLDTINIQQQKLHAEEQNQNSIEKMMSQVQVGSEEWNQYNQMLQESIQAQMDLGYSIKETNDQLQEQQKQIADDVIEILKEGYEKQKELVLENLDNQIDAIEKEADAFKEAQEAKIKALDEESDKLDEVYNARLKLIDKTEEEADYNKKLTDAQEDAQGTLNKINVLKNSDDLSDIARRKELEKQYTEQLEAIQEMQHEREIELRKTSLQEELEAKQKDIEAQKEAEQKKIDDREDAVKRQIENIEKVKKVQEKAYDELINNERYFQQLRTEIMNGNYANATAALNSLKSFYLANTSQIGTSITVNMIDKITELNTKMSTASTTLGGYFKTMTTYIDSTIAKINALIAKLSELSGISVSSGSSSTGTVAVGAAAGIPTTPVVGGAAGIGGLAGSLGGTVKYAENEVKNAGTKSNPSVGSQDWWDMVMGRKYHTGGKVGEPPLQKDEVPAILKNSEWVLTKGHAEIVAKQSMLLNNLAFMTNRPDLSNISAKTQAPMINVTNTFHGFSGSKQDAVRFNSEINKIMQDAITRGFDRR